MTASDTRRRRRRSRWYKAVIQGPRGQAVLARLLAGYVRLAAATTCWREEGPQWLQEHVRAGRPVIVVLWHQRLMMLPRAWRGVTREHPCHVLISTHRDGELLARTFTRLGLGLIRGSSSRGGAGAFQQLLEHLHAGASVAITPDGPRGPRLHVAGGVLHAARKTGVPIVPVTFACSSRAVLRSWDRFVIACPFARGIIAWGEPFHVAPDLDEAGFEARRGELERTLTALTQDADRRLGKRVIEPAPG